MRIVFDECVPRQLRRLFPEEWEVRLLREPGWLGKLDPTLLDLIADDPDVFVTADPTLRFQNRFAGRSFGVVSLELHSNATDGLALHLPLILAAIREIRPMQVLVVTPHGIASHP